jgi:hypothetical protein
MRIVVAAYLIAWMAQTPSGVIRGEGNAVRTLVGRGMERSATFRDLATRLTASDVTVYVQYSRCPGVAPACLQWVSAAPGIRRLLVKVDGIGRSENEQIALLAHELQHANEVAATPAIQDLASFRQAFSTRGWRGGDGFETAEAKDITRRVAAELIR